MSTTTRNVSVEDLKNAVPLRSLPQRTLGYIAKLATLEQMPSGYKLFGPDEKTDHVYYLIEGKVSLNHLGEEPRIIAAGTTKAHFPLNHQNPCEHEAVTSGPATLVRLERELLQSIERIESTGITGQVDGIELVDDELGERLYVDFYRRLQEDRLELPGMPDMAVRISKTVDNPATDSADIARIIQLDPALTLRIVQVANSPAYAGRYHIDSCPDAVSRLGRQTVRNLVISFVLKNIFHTRYPALRQRMSELWVHSRRVASLCHILASMTPELDADRALLAGLIHDIGAIPILDAVSQHPELTENLPLIDRTVARLRAEVGAMTLRKWGFGEEFVEAALHAEEWMRDEKETPDYTDLVIVSQLHAYIGTARMQELPRLDLTPAFQKLAHCGLGPQQSARILDEAQAEIEAVEQLLG